MIFEIKFDESKVNSLLPDVKPNLFPCSEKRASSGITWCPPIQNWNCWNGCNIDEGHLASVRF